MYEVVIFGGTTEGRRLAEELDRRGVKTLVCVATEYGESLLGSTENIAVHTGRLDIDDMVLLLEEHTPRYVIDSTHPYAEVVSHNAKLAVSEMNIKYIRIIRDKSDVQDCIYCNDLDEIVKMANSIEGNIFAAMGAKSANALTAISDYRHRLFMRILPMPQGLEQLLANGFAPSNIICMQGPFSKELNFEMFRAADARVLITKDSGRVGGFEEKIEAARLLDMKILVLKRPEDGRGMSVEEAISLIRGD